MQQLTQSDNVLIGRLAQCKLRALPLTVGRSLGIKPKEELSAHGVDMMAKQEMIVLNVVVAIVSVLRL